MLPVTYSWPIIQQLYTDVGMGIVFMASINRFIFITFSSFLHIFYRVFYFKWFSCLMDGFFHVPFTVVLLFKYHFKRPSGCPVHLSPSAFTRVLCMYRIRWMNFTIAVAQRGTPKSGKSKLGDEISETDTKCVVIIIKHLDVSIKFTSQAQYIKFKINSCLGDQMTNNRAVAWCVYNFN